ncbi:MAG: mercury resistance system periplasmic binding protein MerP [Methylosarcina sp.]
MPAKIFSIALAFTVASGAALAAPLTATLDIPSMTCAVCPITVKKALENVKGVQHVTVDYASKTATVQFDDTMATTANLTKATLDAGYPSAVKENGK